MIQNTRIRLFNQVEGYLDTDETTVVPLTFSIAEIKDLSKRKGTFSKSIKIPGTKNNNILLNNYFDVNVLAGTFDINKKVNCAIIQNGITILDNAIMQLVSVDKVQNTLRENDSHTYTILIKDTTSDLFSKINNKKLEDIDLQFANHLYTANNVIASFDNTIADGYKYVMPYNPMVVDDINFNLNEFTPAIYARLYFDKIINSAGYSYNWPSMNDDDIRFDKLLIPYNGDAKSDVSLTDPIFTVTGKKTIAYTQSTTYSLFNSNPSYNGVKPSTAHLSLIPETSDPSNLYSGFIYTAPNFPSLTNNTKFKIKVEYEVKVRNSSSQTRKLLGADMFDRKLKVIPTMTIQRFENAWNTNFANLDMSNLSGNGNLEIPVNYTIPGNTTTTIQTATADMTFIANGVGPNTKYQFSTKIDVSPNTSFSYMYWADTGNAPRRNDVFIDMVVKNIYFSVETELNGELGYNVPIQLNSFIPKNIKQSDYLKSIFTMFNLYVEVDKDNPTQLNIIKRDDYYDNGAEKNWTQKLVKDKPQEIKFLPEISKKKLRLTYKEDKDWANEQYKNNVGEVYGQALYTFDNEFVIDEEKIEVIYSPTPVKNSPVLNAVLPMWDGQAPKTNIRILYDGGQQTCNSYNIFNYSTSVYAPPAVISSNKYPLITHWDKATNPTFDLNFLSPKYYYRTDDWGSDTVKNLFNSHWRRTANQINNGRLMTAYFYLNENDIAALKLSDKIRINNVWWNINKIQDYDANSTEPTKVELITVDDEIKVEFIASEAVGIQQSSPILNPLHILAESLMRSKNTIYSEGIIKVAGFNNTVTESSAILNLAGNNNSVGGNGLVIGSENISNNDSIILGNNNQTDGAISLVFGDSNTVSGDNVSNVIILGDNVTASTNNTLYTENIIMPSGGTINGISVSAVTNDTYVTSGTFNSTTGTLSINQNNGVGPVNISGFNNGLTGYVTTNTSQTITGLKNFTNILNLKKNDTSFNPSTSGGYFNLGNPTGTGYDRFDFYSLDGTDADSFGIAQMYSNPEEGNYIGHSRLGFQSDARLEVNYNNFRLLHIYGGQQTGLYIDGINDKIKIEGTQNKFAALGTSLITGTKNFEFPNQSGTIALLSDITGSTGTDIRVTGGTYNNTTGTATFTNNTGGTFNVTGFNTGYTLTSAGITSALGYTPVSADTFTTGGTYSSGTLTLNNNNGSSFNVTGFTTSGGGSGYWSGGTGINSIISIQNTSFPNIATGNTSFAIGYNTKALGDYSYSEGQNTIAYGVASHAEGNGTLAFSNYSHAEGYNTQANNNSAHAEGNTTIANTIHSHSGGRKSQSSVIGEWCRSSSDLSDVMLPQYGIIDLTRRTTGTAITQITAGGGLENISNTIGLIPGTTMRFKFVGLAVVESTGACKEWEGQGLIKNVGGTTAMVGFSNVPTYADTGMSAVLLSVAADNTNDRLVFQGQGLAGTPIRWYVKVDYIKMN